MHDHKQPIEGERTSLYQRATMPSSTTPNARSVAFCASVNPLTPLILTRSYGRSHCSVCRCSPPSIYQTVMAPLLPQP